jgi:hypothetical protein
MKHSDSVFHTSDRAETVIVVGDLVINREALRGRRGIGNVKRTGRQMAPGHGVVRAHCYQHVPAWAAGCKEPSRDSGRGGIRRSGAFVGSRLRACHPASVWRCRSTCAAAGPRLVVEALGRWGP